MNQHSLLQSMRTLATRTLLASLLTSIAFALVLAPACSAQAAAKPAAAQKPSASVAQTGAPSIASLRAGFANPPNEARPMVRWWWFGTAVVKPEILRELQQMKADGIQGAELAFEYPQVLDDPAKGLKNLPFLSPEMLDDVAYAQAEGRKLGLRIDLTLCSGWPYGGPKTTLAEAVTRIRVAQVAVPAGASSVASPSLAEGESLIASRHRRDRCNAGCLPLRLPVDRAAQEHLPAAEDATPVRLRQPMTQPPPSRSTSLAAAPPSRPPISPAPHSSSFWATPSSR